MVSFCPLSIRYFSDALQCLYPLLGESELDDAVRDNAAGAVSKMIIAHQDSVPLNQVGMLVDVAISNHLLMNGLIRVIFHL